MPLLDRLPRRLRALPVTLAYRTETAVRDGLARWATGRGWTTAVIPYSGYAGPHHARVLGRVVLAPAAVDPGARRGVPGWRRLLTLERPRVEVRVELDGVTSTVTSDEAGIVDARLPLTGAVPAGPGTAWLRVGDRDPVGAPVHVAPATPVRGVVCDIDDTVWVTGVAHPLRAAWRTLRGTSTTRRSVPGMARLLQAGVEGQPPVVVYLSNGPWNLVGPVSRFLERHGFPAGAVLMTDWGITPRRWFRDGRRHKASSLARLAEDLPEVTWVLVGDDGEHDPDLYREFARSHPGRVAAIALRQVLPHRPTAAADAAVSPDGPPVLRGADGDVLLPLLREVLQAHAR